MCVCVCVCRRNELEVCSTLAYPHNYQFIPYYTIATHKQTHTRILKPCEDSEPMGLKVDIAESNNGTGSLIPNGMRSLHKQWCSLYLKERRHGGDRWQGWVHHPDQTVGWHRSVPVVHDPQLISELPLLRCQSKLKTRWGESKLR